MATSPERAVLYGAADRRDGPRTRFLAVRQMSDDLAAPLAPEDQTVQSMPDASPTKWHLAHVSWFFETFLLKPHAPGYETPDPRFAFLFNSYYQAAGPRHARPQRGLISRPGVGEVAAYRRHVTEAMQRLIETASEETWSTIELLIEIGCHHEQQHQELLLIDVKHVLSMNPLLPAYQPTRPAERRAAPPVSWIGFEGGLHAIGHDGRGFAYDNEGPRHKTWLEPFRVASRLVTAGEYLEFVEDGGYRRPDHWLSDGWTTVEAEGWEAPLYWRKDGDDWSVFTLEGPRRLDPAEPVCHVSHYEADAFAKWSGKRLPTEAEWEVASETAPIDGHVADAGLYHPQPCDDGPGLRQMIGEAWEWTQSAYLPYRGYRAPEGAIGEYNGKFMSGQMVLRGGAAVTPPDHVRRTYRNFFPPSARWTMSGFRMADDA